MATTATTLPHPPNCQPAPAPIRTPRRVSTPGLRSTPAAWTKERGSRPQAADGALGPPRRAANRPMTPRSRQAPRGSAAEIAVDVAVDVAVTVSRADETDEAWGAHVPDRSSTTPDRLLAPGEAAAGDEPVQAPQ